MESQSEDVVIDEAVVREILDVRQRGWRARDIRIAIFAWGRGVAFAAAMLILAGGLILAWVRRADPESLTPWLFVIAGLGACLLSVALVVHWLHEINVGMPRKWADLSAHYWEVYPAESEEAVEREWELGEDERDERTSALEAIIRHRSTRSQGGDR